MQASGHRRQTRTHHDTPIEALGTYSDHNVAPIALQNLASADHKTVRMSARVLALAIPRTQRLLVVDLPDCVTLTCGAALVAPDVVPAEEDSIARNDLAGFQQCDVSDDDFVYINNALVARADNLDATFFLLLVQSLELTLLLPVVDRADKDLRAPMRSMMGRKIPNERVWKVSKNESSAQ